MSWTPIVGKGFTPDEFRKYALGLTLYSWKPQFIVLHNTSEPTIAQWHKHPGNERMKNLEDYYKNREHWTAGPHLFVADDLIWAFTPLWTPGVHSPSWNAISAGVEMVGEYGVESFTSGLGEKVHENAISAIATLCELWRLDSSTLRFHKEDPKTTHKECPGKHVIKADMLLSIHNELIRRKQQ